MNIKIKTEGLTEKMNKQIGLTCNSRKRGDNNELRSGLFRNLVLKTI